MSDRLVKEDYQYSRIQKVETKCPCALNYGGDAMVSNCQKRLSQSGRRWVDHDAVVTRSSVARQ